MADREIISLQNSRSEVIFLSRALPLRLAGAGSRGSPPRLVRPSQADLTQAWPNNLPTRPAAAS